MMANSNKWPGTATTIPVPIPPITKVTFKMDFEMSEEDWRWYNMRRELEEHKAASVLALSEQRLRQAQEGEGQGEQ